MACATTKAKGTAYKSGEECRSWDELINYMKFGDCTPIDWRYLNETVKVEWKDNDAIFGPNGLIEICLVNEDLDEWEYNIYLFDTLISFEVCVGLNETKISAINWCNENLASIQRMEI